MTPVSVLFPSSDFESRAFVPTVLNVNVSLALRGVEQLGLPCTCSNHVPVCAKSSVGRPGNVL